MRRFTNLAPRAPVGCLLLAFAAACFAGRLIAAPAHAVKLEWQPIAPADLALKDNPAAPGADAMTLYHEIYIDNWNLAVLEYVRIKIFTAAARKYGDVSIPFVPGLLEIKDLRARTIDPGGRILDLDPSAVHDEVVVKARKYKVLEKKFSLAEVQPGSIVEYMYRHQRSPEYSIGYEWPVQGELYLRQGVFSIRTSLVSSLSWTTFHLPPINLTRQPDGSVRLEVKDLRGVKSEDFMPPDRAVRGRVGFVFRFNPNGQETTEQYWKSMGKVWDKGFEDSLRSKSLVAQTTGEIVRPGESPDLALRKLYERAQKVRNLDFQDEPPGGKHKKAQPNENVDDVIKRGAGTGLEINLAFAAMVRAAGYDATQVFTTSRDKDFFAPALQDPDQLDRNLVFVRIGDQELFLDPGNPYFPYGLLPWYLAGTKAVRLRPGGGELVTTAPPKSSDAIQTREARLRINAEGALDGKLEVEFRGQRACQFRELEREEDAAGRDKDLVDRIKEWLPVGAVFEIESSLGWDSSSLPIRVVGKLHIPDYVTLAGKHATMPLVVFVSSAAKAFTSSTRFNDIYFEYPYEEWDDIHIELPPGRRAEATPHDEAEQGPSLKFSVSTASDGHTIDIKRRLAVEEFLFSVKQYTSIRDFFSKVQNAAEQQIVISLDSH